MTDRNPHLLHVEIVSDRCGTNLGLRLECPYPREDLDKGCTLWEECPDDCPGEPESPESDEPEWTYDKVKGRCYAEDAPPEVVKAWDEFYDVYEAYEESHPHGRWHAAPGCWAEDAVRTGRVDDEWFLDESLAGTPVISPIPVDWRNDGYMEESMLYLTKWVKPDGE